MQQPSTSIELPQFSSIAAVALDIARRCANWRDAGTGEDFVTYFSHTPRHTGDELGLRATLIRETILPIFHYASSDIEFESQERFDLTLRVQSGQDRRRIALVETKSSSIQNLASVKKGHETPVEQLERYVTQAGIYLGVLTNGDEWHLFDFAVGHEPLASFSLVALTQLLHDAPDVEAAALRLADQPHIQQALVVTFYYLNAQRWQQTNIFRKHIANPAYHRIASLKNPDHVETLVSQIKLVLGSLRETIRAQFSLLQARYDESQYTSPTDEEFALSKQAVESYLTWQTSVHDIFSNPVSEFCLQTAYIAFVRLFFVRVCEDHNLIPRRISDDPFTRFEQCRTELLSGIKDTYTRLLEETYQRARSVYHNFFEHSKLYDWFTLDEYTILALFDLLNRFDFQCISADVLGRVYNEGYIETKARSEHGQFYTPPQVVDYMLDSIGIPSLNEADDIRARAFLEKSVGDLSCGSGTFLVAAAARKSAILRRLVATDEVSADYALHILTRTFLGFDRNSFACYLAEINLLIQCLPFLLDDKGRLYRSIHRFHIYSTDSLEPTRDEQTRADIFGEATHRLKPFPPSNHKHILSEDERNIISIKHAKGMSAEITELHSDEKGLDYLLGNPPYVSAGESAENLPYRHAVWEYGIYHLLHQRWDLFVPFFERNLQFLRPETGRLGLIVSNGIETEGYAERLRGHLSSQYRLLQIDFFPNLRLFQDAAVENTIVLVENRPPDEEHTVNRRRHQQRDCRHYAELPPTPQLASNGQIFRWRYDAQLDERITQGSIPLCAIVYIGTGMEAQSKEDFDPVVNGKRQKRFTLNNVFLPPTDEKNRPAEYTDTGVLGDDVGRYFLRRTRYVAYEKYRPQMRGPRHKALFQTPEKLLLGETSGGYYDRAGLFANHSVQVVVSWKALEEAGAIEKQGIQTVLRNSQQIAGITNGIAAIAELFDLRYLLGIINSRFIRQYLASNRLEGTRKRRIYPDVWKRLPIKIASKDKQDAIAAEVDAVQALYQQKVQTQASIENITAEIEDLVEAIYYEPPDEQMMEIIQAKMQILHNGSLF